MLKVVWQDLRLESLLTNNFERDPIVAPPYQVLVLVLGTDFKKFCQKTRDTLSKSNLFRFYHNYVLLFFARMIIFCFFGGYTAVEILFFLHFYN